MTRALLGCIADDFTGATDLANNLVRAGMRVVQAMGVPTAPLDTEADAIVVALKSRTIPKDEAIAQSLAALQWLKAQGAEQIYFKYCSTFDSTAEGNIGPVTDALMQALGTPADPDYPAFAVPRIVEGLQRAVANMAPARVGWATAQALRHTHNRVWIRRRSEERV